MVRQLAWLSTVLLALATGGCAGADDGADASGSDLSAGSSAQPGLLALGDSISYGWDPSWSESRPGQPTNPANLQKAVLGRGFPEKAAKTLALAASNGTCPGEASGSFIDATQPDNGCREKRAMGLKMTTPWGTAQTQLDFAISQVKSAHPPSVITLTLGGNDLFLLQASCEGALLGSSVCIAAAAKLGTSGAPVAKYGDHVNTLLTSLHTAGYRGAVVVVTTYAMDYAGFGEPLVFGAFNDALRDAVKKASVVTPGMRIVIADGYEKFRSRAAENAEFSNNACKAGLLIDQLDGQPILDPDGKPTCDRHPSQAGHELLAEAVVEALR